MNKYSNFGPFFISINKWKQKVNLLLRMIFRYLFSENIVWIPITLSIDKQCYG